MSKTYLQSEPVKFTEQEVFEGYFDQRGYLTMYYPEITNVRRLFSVSKKICSEYGESGRVNVGTLAKRAGINHEIIENILILDFQMIVARKLLEAFPAGNARVLDVAGGSTIYQHIALALIASHITHSEFSARGRYEVLEWLHEAPDAYNWDGYFKLLQKLLKANEAYTEVLSRNFKSRDKKIAAHAKHIRSILRSQNEKKLKDHLKQTISDDVIYGDVFDPELGLLRTTAFHTSLKKKSVDVVTAHFSIESATSSKTKWEEGMDNILSFVRKDGFLVLTAIRNAEWYYIHTKKFPAVSVSENDIERKCRNAGFNVIEMRVLEDSNREKCGYDGMILLLAQRIA